MNDDIETISQRALELLYGRKLPARLEWVLTDDDRLFHRLDAETWVEFRS